MDGEEESRKEVNIVKLRSAVSLSDLLDGWLEHVFRQRFSNRRRIGSYTGLCPGEYSTGDTRLQTCVTKHGNPRLRAALVEAAWRLVRFQPNYKPVVKWRQTLCQGALATKAARKKAIVAVARRLAVDLWRIRTSRISAQELGLIN